MRAVATSPSSRILERVEGTVALIEQRGYALAPLALGRVCLGGCVSEAEVLAAVARSPSLRLREGLVVGPSLLGAAPRIARRALEHDRVAGAYLRAALRFVRTLTRLNPYILAVSIAGSLASGGFLETDDVDLNLVVEDGRRHLAYVAINTLALVHALRYRGKPTDVHTRRPLAPRVMSANLILERSQCFPLARQDAAMAYELLTSRPVHGAAWWARVVSANPRLASHFPQLRAPLPVPEPERGSPLPGWLFPRLADRPARWLGRAGWRWMQSRRRHDPEALARVAFVRETMRPYTLFDESADGAMSRRRRNGRSG